MVRVPIWTAVAIGLMACLVAGENRRRLWTLGGLFYFVHVWAVFDRIHGWSEARALAHTAEVTAAVTGWSSNFGLYVNYAFTLAWLGIVTVLWMRPKLYAGGLRWTWEGWFLFMAFNGAIVFVLNPLRWLGIGLFVAFGIGVAVRATLKKTAQASLDTV